MAIFFIPSISDPFLGQIQPHPYSVEYDLDINTLIKSQLFIFLFLFSFFLTLKLSKKQTNLKNHFTIQKDSNDSKGLLWITIFLILSSYGIIEVYTKSGGSLYQTLGFIEYRENISFVSKFLLSYNLLICAGTLFWLTTQKKYIVSIAFIVLYVFIFLLIGGSRQPLIALALPFLFNFIFLSKRGFIYSIILILSFGAFSFILEFLLHLRNIEGLENKIDAIKNIFQFILSENKVGSSEDSLRFAFYYFVKIGDAETEFGMLTYFTRILLFWLPSSLDFFSIKPPDFEYTMFSAFMPEYIGTMHPTFFGTIYADSGWFFIPWILYFLALVKITPYFLKKYHGASFFAAWTLLAHTYMMMARGSIYGPLILLILGFIFLWVARIFYIKIKFRLN